MAKIVEDFYDPDMLLTEKQYVARGCLAEWRKQLGPLITWAQRNPYKGATSTEIDRLIDEALGVDANVGPLLNLALDRVEELEAEVMRLHEALIVCIACDGTGKDSYHDSACPACKGTGASS